MMYEKLKASVHTLCAWYDLHARPLPWRLEPDSYRVWISEIMLQQTRIEAVIPHYYAFLEKIPDLTTLANISEEKLLKCWEGLGYYSRARNLQKAAKTVLAQGRTDLPETYQELLQLPGIGEYTAGAIASIVFNESVPAVDGNVMRVLARLTGSQTNVLSPAGKKEFTALANELLPVKKAGLFNQAIMELGETICLPNGAPRCDRCPLQEICEAKKQGRAAELPVRLKKTLRQIENRTVFLVHTDTHILLHKRPDKGLLAGLYEFPSCSGEMVDREALSFLSNFGISAEKIVRISPAKHIFTHKEWHMNGFAVLVPKTKKLPGEYVWVTKEQLQKQYAVPSAFRHYLNYIAKNL